jgi:hypothetical protein
MPGDSANGCRGLCLPSLDYGKRDGGGVGEVS